MTTSTLTHFPSIIDNKLFDVPMELLDYTIYQRKSSSVCFLGVDTGYTRLYVQFISGKGYVYTNLDIEFITGAINAPNITAFIQVNLIKTNAKFESVGYSIKEI